MKTKILVREKKSKNKLRDEPLLDSFISEEDASNLRKILSKAPRVREVDISFGRLDPITYPIGFKVRGEFDLARLYQKITSNGYSITRAKVEVAA